MKKMIKAMSVIAAIAMLGAGFIGCSSDDDDDDGVDGSAYIDYRVGFDNTDLFAEGNWTTSDKLGAGSYAETAAPGDDTCAVSEGIGEIAKCASAKEIKIPSVPAGYTVTIPSGICFNKVSLKEKGSAITIEDASKYGFVEPWGDKQSDDYISVEVDKACTIIAYVTANSNSPKTDRYSFIKDADKNEVYAPNKATTTIGPDGDTLAYVYDGSKGKTKFYIGGTSCVRIHDIIVRVNK